MSGRLIHVHGPKRASTPVYEEIDGVNNAIDHLDTNHSSKEASDINNPNVNLHFTLNQRHLLLFKTNATHNSLSKDIQRTLSIFKRSEWPDKSCSTVPKGGLFIARAKASHEGRAASAV